MVIVSYLCDWIAKCRGARSEGMFMLGEIHILAVRLTAGEPTGIGTPDHMDYSCIPTLSLGELGNRQQATDCAKQSQLPKDRRRASGDPIAPNKANFQGAGSSKRARGFWKTKPICGRRQGQDGLATEHRQSC
jgi:hypothetical protein